MIHYYSKGWVIQNERIDSNSEVEKDSFSTVQNDWPTYFELYTIHIIIII